jgi:hypothetical protein
MRPDKFRSEKTERDMRREGKNKKRVDKQQDKIWKDKSGQADKIWKDRRTHGKTGPAARQAMQRYQKTRQDITRQDKSRQEEI